METHPKMVVQFMLDGPFDPIETLSVTFKDQNFDNVECIVLGGKHPQYELWSLIADVAASHMSRYGLQEELHLD